MILSITLLNKMAFLVLLKLSLIIATVNVTKDLGV